MILLTTDTKAGDTHFPRGFADFDKGWTIAAANLSDIAAMGGSPVGFLVAYGMPRDTPFEMLHDIQAGIDACLTEFSTPLVGADTKENRTLTLTGTAVGLIDKREVLLRKGSHPGDLVCVSGPLGGAKLGLDSMQEGLGILLAEAKFRRPMPRIAEGRVLATSGVCTSCMDISDGLSSSLYELMRASGNGFEIDSACVPMHESLHDLEVGGEERLEIAMDSGDEYELLFTVRPDAVSDLKRIFDEEAEHELTTIGRVTSEKEIVLCGDFGRSLIPDGGFEHFK